MITGLITQQCELITGVMKELFLNFQLFTLRKIDGKFVEYLLNNCGHCRTHTITRTHYFRKIYTKFLVFRTKPNIDLS